MATCPAHGEVQDELMDLSEPNQTREIWVPGWSCGCLPGAYEPCVEPPDANLIVPDEWH